ncbi:SIR2 family protein [Phototrophicus methaneseepsis]|uniref:SIR2 family protein n=1 Tax=Phototrophicus methaneseepsis TaxID=2710758 RepID=A0A7S8IEQ8_9CHLR|nr:SIR2 family protein [Phototrophicus methaneseepsis]QPC82063.1 SIR2 family protein [Phototrophicus methaneseepsis]
MPPTIKYIPPKDADDKECEYFKSMLAKSLQSATINFLIGSGASFPAVEVAGNIEEEIQILYQQNKIDEADRKKADFINKLQGCANDLIELVEDDLSHEDKIVLQNYRNLLETLELIMTERKTDLLSKQINLFTTNYDLFVEQASDSLPSLLVNDGFNRTPNLKQQYKFSPSNFFNTTYNQGNLYSYKVEIPVVNLIKIHGSLSWTKQDEGTILFSSNVRNLLSDNTNDGEVCEFLKNFALILPQKSKFEQTLMDRIHYDLLRIYANELDKENSLLIVFGFSFADEHIFDITKRALKNPSLRLVIFAYSNDDVTDFKEKFAENNNVVIIAPSKTEKNTFLVFDNTLNLIFS